MTTDRSSVCVIIPAWNASATIARAVRSAMAQPDVSEVIVVDDYSSDDTGKIATACDDGSGRLSVVRQPYNQGPAAARNHAIARSRADFIAVLDADDYLLPNRFVPLLVIDGWDLIADNIVFVPDMAADAFDARTIAPFDVVPQRIDLPGFIDGNLSRPGRSRAEMGFAKPVMRRAFIEKYRLGYDESLRLGEDYALYAKALALGAVFLRVRRCGYVAIERADSLSGRHATADLSALLAFDRAFAQTACLSPAAHASLDRHMRQLAIKVGHRVFLDTKRAHGLARATTEAIKQAGTLPGIATAILRDKLMSARQPPAHLAREPRYLFS